jgi:hypothetical protein
MKLSPVAVLSFLVLGCSHSASFDQEVWLQNSGVEDTRNPRAYMVQDVIKNHLRAGMTRQQVVQKLGVPYKEAATYLLPPTMDLPDSLRGPDSVSLSEEQQKQLDARSTQFFRTYGQRVKLLEYPVGWSIIDPRFLTVALTPDGRVLRSWVDEH